MDVRRKRLDSSNACILLRDYEGFQKLGSGWFGLVVKAKLKEGNSFSAIKLVQLDSRQTSEETLAEAEKHFKLPKHACVVTCTGYWFDEFTKVEHEEFLQVVKPKKKEPLYEFPSNMNKLQFLCIRMELCGNGTLKTWLKNRKEFQLNEEENITIFFQILRGLKHIHGHKLIHRDLKPANILFDGKVTKISDLGWSVVHNSGDYSHTFDAGAALYKAPEQTIGKYGPLVDYYALGLILFELFYPPAQKNVGEALLPLKHGGIIPPELSEKHPIIAELIKKMIAFSPADRPSFDAIVMELNKALVPLHFGVDSMSLDEDNNETDCNYCRGSLGSGVRYKCSVCPEFWLCEKCEGLSDDNGVHVESHDLLKIKKPAAKKYDSNGCRHYRRKCKLQCPTPDCNRIFFCRFCHDENVKGHQMNRFEIDQIQCTACGLHQTPRATCLICKTQFANYFCEICNLFDDSEDANKLIFHCSSCGICRKKANESIIYSHCDNCSMCYPASLLSIGRAGHTCVKNAGTILCTVCGKDIHKSRDAAILVDCHHYVHEICRAKFPNGTRKCPPCGNW